MTELVGHELPVELFIPRHGKDEVRSEFAALAAGLKPAQIKRVVAGRRRLPDQELPGKDRGWQLWVQV